MTDFIFLSVAFGPRYIEQQTRLHNSILNFYSSDHHIAWTDTLPPGAKPHKESLYGFKVDAVGYALKKGYQKIIWLDPACILVDKIDYYFQLDTPVMAVKDDNLLSNYIGDKAMKYYGNPDITRWHLVGGSIYVFDFTKEKTAQIFDDWANAEDDGIFGSQQEQAIGKINRHRNDESCMAMALYINGCEPTPYDVARYDKVNNPIVTKLHFK